MRRALIGMATTVAAVLLVMAGLWAWQGAADWVLDWGADRPQVAAWALRSAGIAAVAAAQMILLTGVVTRFYRRGKFDTVVASASAFVFALALAGAIVCGFTGR